MADETDDIKRYLSGQMSGAERHAFEKRALNDPFLAEAIDGAESIMPHEFSNDVDDLSKKIRRPVKAPGFTPLRIAAGIIVMVAAGSLIIYFYNHNQSI